MRLLSVFQADECPKPKVFFPRIILCTSSDGERTQNRRSWSHSFDAVFVLKTLSSSVYANCWPATHMFFVRASGARGCFWWGWFLGLREFVCANYRWVFTEKNNDSLVRFEHFGCFYDKQSLKHPIFSLGAFGDVGERKFWPSNFRGSAAVFSLLSTKADRVHSCHNHEINGMTHTSALQWACLQSRGNDFLLIAKNLIWVTRNDYCTFLFNSYERQWASINCGMLNPWVSGAAVHKHDAFQISTKYVSDFIYERTTCNYVHRRTTMYTMYLLCSCMRTLSA